MKCTLFFFQVYFPKKRLKNFDLLFKEMGVSDVTVFQLQCRVWGHQRKWYKEARAHWSTWVFLDSRKRAHPTVVSSLWSHVVLVVVHNFNQIMKTINMSIVMLVILLLLPCRQCLRERERDRERKKGGGGVQSLSCVFIT